MFSFFSELKTIGSDQLNKKCEHLANVYHKDLDYGDHLNECEHLKHCMVLGENCETLPALYRKIISDNLKFVFPNVEIALKSVHVHDGHQLYRRTFIFKTETYLKNQLRSTMRQQRYNWFSLVCMENNILNTIDFKAFMKQFSAKKFRKCLC
jgi:hypothetical protein